MMISLWIYATLAVFASVFLLNSLVLRKRQSRNLPPSPKGLPILGHLHLLGKYPHRDLHKLAKEHGPIMHLRFGFVSNVIVSSPHAAEQFLKTHDVRFASRPPHEAAKYIGFGQKDVSFSQYGPYWRVTRKLCTLNLLSSVKISSFQSMRKEEIGLFVESLNIAALNCDVVDVSGGVAALIADMACLMVFGKKYENKDIDETGIVAVVKDSLRLLATPNLGDYYPFLGVLDLQGLTKKLKAVSKLFDKFFEKIIEEHEHELSSDQARQADDLVYIMLDLMRSGDTEFQFDRQNIKAIMWDMLAGSIDTSAASVEWIFSELLKHPRVLKKVQQELEEVVGLDRMVEESDLGSLKYLDTVIKEGLRLHPAGPLTIPHFSMEECVVDGFHIPKDSRVIVNLWAIGRDPNAWCDPEEFVPERFIGSNIDVKGRDFQLLPFGSGRRSCAGIQLGLTVVRLLVAQMAHCFNWELPNGVSPAELDMTEEFGLVVSRAKHLMAVPTYRLSK